MSPSPTQGGATPKRLRDMRCNCPCMTISDVAHHLNVRWDMIKDFQKRDLSRRYAKPKLKHLRYIAIDEIAVAKGHHYLTIVMDLVAGRSSLSAMAREPMH